MPGLTSKLDDLAMVPVSSETYNQPAVIYPLRHGVESPIHRLSISWACGNTLRVSVFQKPQSETAVGDGEAGGRVVEVQLSNSGNEEVDAARWRRKAYSSVTPFALLQSRKHSLSAASKMSLDTTPYKEEWWEHVTEYSKEISSLLSDRKLSPRSIIEDPKLIVTEIAEPMCLKAAWELFEIFYIDKHSQSWIPERLQDWLADYTSLFSGTLPTIHSKLVDFQQELVVVQVVEEDPNYWDAMSSALAVGWLETVVKLLRLHGSYQFDQLSSRETENGLVEAVAVLISKMPRMRPSLREENLGECYKTKPDFMKAWEKWRTQISKLDCSSYWLQCDHQQTREGLKNLIQIMLGNPTVLSNATFNWMELFISHFLYIKPFTAGLESMHNSAQKCMQLKPVSSPHKLFGLILGILGENTEVVLAECSRSFGPWMMAHAVELLTAGSTHADILLHEERSKLGGVSIEELHRLVYAQVLSSHALTWQIAPIYLTSCIKQGIGLLENLLYKQPVQHSQILLKSIEICRLYELDTVSSNIMRIAGVHHWKHGRKGSGVFWLQQARDEFRLNRIAKHLFDFVGKSTSDEGFKQWEGLIELLGSESRTAGGLEFLKKYRDFRRSLLQGHGDMLTDAARSAAEALVSLMKNPSTPQDFWLPLLYDSLKLLMWQERPLINVSQTQLLLNKLQELSMARLRPDFVEADLPSDALSSVRLALATNLGRAILEE
ncbi:Nuclear pore complex protein NUP85 [Capsicum annuum]|uniref:nuclear pore complex protein NUP85 isoform X1 n=1 Tax=Capsicum annuum TaxID=4072 RepID=UPI001FB0C614|nr:nuclear pore complex protein NUP85 isoform X1 [Capsicum annuum]XP_047251643.1 nuclear pore complex protein NUP85 isoform X1 [Capsicum annuum]KAF3635359.1 Nuclear pore complex protein NUP85 [Capsicum annuum]